MEIMEKKMGTTKIWGLGLRLGNLKQPHPTSP